MPEAVTAAAKTTRTLPGNRICCASEWASESTAGSAKCVIWSSFLRTPATIAIPSTKCGGTPGHAVAFLPGNPGRRPTGILDTPPRPRYCAPPPMPPTIEVRGLTKRYRDRIAVDHLTFAVNEGEILGFLGPNGAGKTTTMKILTGSLPASEGSAKVAGFDVFE